MMKNQAKTLCLTLVTAIAGLLLFGGCSGRNTLRESHELVITFVSLAKDDPSYGTFTIHNTSDTLVKIDAVKIMNAESGEKLPSSLLKLTCQSIPPGSWEYGVFQIGKSGLRHTPTLRIEYEHVGNRYFTTRPVEPNHIWVKDFYFSEDFSSMYVYLTPESPLSQEEVASACVTINGETAVVSDYSVLPTANERSIVCLKLTPPHKLNGGERICITTTWDNKTIYGGGIKVFHAFVADRTQYDKIMRPVDLKFTSDSITLNIYNEADFRKCPAVIERVTLNGEDVTATTIFPSEPFPPDLHNYDDDVRPVVVKNVHINDDKKHRFDFDFNRLEPLRPSTTPFPDGYFDLQSFSCDVQYGIPYEIDQEWRLQGGACTFYGGLRDRHELSEFIRRYNSVVSIDPSLPVYAYPHEGTNPTIVHQLAYCSDFIAVGQTIPLLPSTFGKSQKFFEHVQFKRQFHVPWAGSVILDNNHHPSPKDMEWMTWGAIGAGSHGVFLTAHEKGDQDTIKKCQQGVVEILDVVRSMKPLLGISKPVDLAFSCNQEGIHFDFLACGTDHIMIVALNEWSTRSAFQESEPFMAAIRRDVELKVSPGTDWRPVVAVDPINRQPLSFTENLGEISLRLPDFDNVQVVQLSRNQIEEVLPGFQSEKIEAPPEPLAILLANPMVSLGTIRPGSICTLDIPVRSITDRPITLSGTEVSDPGSKPGEVQISDVTLVPHERVNLSIQYTATDSSGKSVTHVRFTSPEYPDFELPVYFCAEVEQPAEISPVMIDFGSLATGTTSTPREIKLKAPDAATIISKVTADNEMVKNIVIADDKKSFRFAVFSDEEGTFSAQLTVEILIGGGSETFVQTVRCTGQFRPFVFASPPQVSIIMSDQPRKYIVGIQHVSGLSIKITSISSGDALQCSAPPENYNREQSVELTILPTILETGRAEVIITGMVEGGGAFTLTVPVSAFSTL